MKLNLLPLFSFIFMLNLCSCSEVECPLDSVVVMTCGLYDADTKEKLNLEQTLTVKPMGKDTVFLNAAIDMSDFVLPLKYAEATDSMLFHFSDRWGQTVTDTLVVCHDNIQHFESVECPTVVFHQLISVDWANENTTAAASFLTIDSVAIVRKLVDYTDVENIQIYLRSAR